MSFIEIVDRGEMDLLRGWRQEMKCQRCLRGAEATYRAYTEAMELKVCAACAGEARRLGIAVEALDAIKREKRSQA